MDKHKPKYAPKVQKSPGQAILNYDKGKDRAKEEKLLKIKHLNDEIHLLQSQLAKSHIDVTMSAPTERLKAEIKNLEIKIVEQRSLQARLEDKYQMLERRHVESCKALDKSHTVVMDAEELDYMGEAIENKKNELLSSRNFVSEMQKIGWTNLPPKVADECKKTHIELDYIHSTTRKYKKETEDLLAELKECLKQLKDTQNEYKEKKKLNTKLEAEVDEIIVEVEHIAKIVYPKEKQAEEMNIAVKNIEKEIKEAEEQEKINKKITKKEQERLREERHKRNKILEDLENKQIVLQEEYEKKEAYLKEKQTYMKQRKFLATDREKYSLKDLIADYQILEVEIEDLQVAIKAETKLKMHYFNILEDMLGRLKTICRSRADSGDNVVEVVEENTVTVNKAPEKYSFDYYFGPKASHENVFDAVEYLYDMANEGFNSYIVTYGGKQTGRSYTILGQHEDGIIWLGLNKIRDIIKNNKKAELTTRMFVCSVEIDDDNIFDLIAGNMNNKIEIKKDAFKMTVLCFATYKECFTDEEVRKLLKLALSNRSQATKSLNSKDTTFVFLVTFQIYNKFQHRYWKGKLTHVKLASFDQVQPLNNELMNLMNGQEINYRANRVTQLLEDCFGGASKTCIVATVNPSAKCAKETATMMNFVGGFKGVVNEIYKNSEPERIYSLKNDIERLLRGLKPENL